MSGAVLSVLFSAQATAYGYLEVRRSQGRGRWEGLGSGRGGGGGEEGGGEGVCLSVCVCVTRSLTAEKSTKSNASRPDASSV